VPQESTGILMFRRRRGALEVLLVHFGGPFWRGKDEGAWSMPKGLIEPGEAPDSAARREFEEELGTRPDGTLVPLGRIRQKGGKWVEAFALEGELDTERIVSNRFTVEWPPRSGRLASYPEVDRACWYDLEEARAKILPSQLPLLDVLEQALAQEKGGRREADRPSRENC
jgi:predicted NUDIX family NTP pyrophosphohydrolase